MRSTTLEEKPGSGAVALHSYGHIRGVVAHGGPNSVDNFHNHPHRTWLSLGPIGLVFCLTNAAIFTAAIAQFLKGEQPYNDLVTGSLVWMNADKGFDVRVFYVFLATTTLMGALLIALCRRLQFSDTMKTTLERGLALALTPGALWLGGRLVTNSLGTPPIECALIGGAVLTLFFSLSRRRLSTTPQVTGSIVNKSLIVLLFAFFGGLGLATALSRVVQASVSLSITTGLVGGTCAFAFTAVILVIHLSSNTEKIEQRMAYVVFGSQVLLPLLCAIVIPPAILEAGHRLVPQPSIALLIALGLLAVSGWLGLYRNWSSWRLGGAGLSQNLVPLAILPITLFLAVDHGSFPTFFGDDFHLGEHLLPWQQFWDFGKLPFVDFVPIHPLMDLFVGATNTFLFDGTLANYANSRAILFAIVAGVTFLSGSRFASIGLALSLALAANVWDRLLLVPAIFVVLCHPQLLSRRQTWLVSWVLICPVSVFYNPAVGIALTLASAPIALIQIWKLFLEDRSALLRLTALFATVAGVICLIPITRAIAFGFAHFLLENGGTVVQAHGLEWRDASPMPSVQKLLLSPFIWELLRFSWVTVLLSAAWVFVSRARNWQTARPETLAISGMAFLFLFFLAGWTLNRIDPLLPSRTGEVSYLAALYILPLILFAVGSWRYVSIPLFVLVLSFFRQANADFINSGSKPHSPLTMAILLEKPGSTPTVPPDCASVDGNSLGMPNLGHVYAPREGVESLEKLKVALSTLLRPGETYFDLTNRQANYFYLGMPVAASYGAPWVAANTVLQNRLLEEIRLRPPPIIWIGPALTQDSGTAALRTYKLYRYLVRNYVPLMRNENVFLVLPDRAGESAPGHKEQMELLCKTFRNENIGRLPSAWGSSWARLEERFFPMQKLKTLDTAPITNGSGVSLPVYARGVSGNSDFIKFDFWSNLSPRSNMPIEIAWTSEHGSGFARFTASNGTNLVPLGAFPDWLLAQQITDLRIVPVSPPPELKYVIRDVRLLKLKD